MNRLAPPPMRRGVPPAESLSIPIGGIQRNAMLTWWRNGMAEPLPDGKALTDELRAWSGALARRGWFAESYGPTPALLLRSPRVRSDQAADWNTVAQTCADLIEPLSRYTAGWCNSLGELRPAGLAAPVATGIREHQRQACRVVRGEMCAPDGVIETEPTATDFVADPAPRHDIDTASAVSVYARGLRRILGEGRAQTHILDEAEAQLLTQHLDRVIADFGVELAAEPTAEEMARHAGDATAFLQPIIEGHYARAGGRDADNLAEAYARVHKTYVNRLAKGLPLEGTEGYLALRIKAVTIDAWRREHRRTAGERAAWEEGHDAPPGPLDDGGHSVVAAAARELASENGCWEVRIAQQILTSQFAGDVTDSAALRSTIESHWMNEQPSDSRSASAAAAAMGVLLLMRSAIGRARLAQHNRDEARS